MMCLWVGEVSNPFNIMRQVFEIQGRPKDSLKAGQGFIAVFLIMRLVSSPALAYYTVFNPEISYILKFCCVLMRNFKLISHRGNDLDLENHEFGSKAACSRKPREPTFTINLQLCEKVAPS